MQPIVLIAPQGTGKTRHAQAIAKHFGCTGIIDSEFSLPPSLPDNVLILANDLDPRWHHAIVILADSEKAILDLLNKSLDDVITDSEESKRQRYLEGETMKSMLKDWAMAQNKIFTATHAAREALKIPQQSLSNQTLTRIAVCLRHLGFKRIDVRKENRVHRYWERPHAAVGV